MLNDNIRRIRLDHNLNQTAFGNILHVSQGAVSQWEKGLTRPDMDILRAISLAFDVALEDILQDEPIPSFRELTTKDKEAPLSREEENIILVYRSMNSEGQKKIKMILDDYSRIYSASYNPML